MFQLSRFFARCCLAGCGVLITVPLHFAAAASDSVLYSFHGLEAGDGAEPGGLIRDPAGNLYGTTSEGGNGQGRTCSHGGCGTVFELAPDGMETVLYAFTPAIRFPRGTLAMDKHGTLYGVTSVGGSEGWGTVYSLAPGGAPNMLHSFALDSGGSYPFAGLLLHGSRLYGTAQVGGDSSSCGTVFELGLDGSNFATLYRFAGGSDGCNPQSELIMDKAGNLYGTTKFGGGGSCMYSCGTVFRIAPDGSETILHAFVPGTNDGLEPVAALVPDDAGNLFGTTAFGGTNQLGTVFEVSAEGTETVLHSFAGEPDDGAVPYSKLLRTRSGDFYGTTYSGGPHDHGTVFRVSPGGSERVVYGFKGRGDGEYPLAGLVADKSGYLYGTTLRGGDGTSCFGQDHGKGCGTVFRVSR